MQARGVGEGTARESAGSLGGPGVGGGTQREGVAGVGPTGGVLLHSLLPSLAGRFSGVRDLDSGGESDVILARDDAGDVWVVKQYRQPGWAPDADVLDVLADRRVGHTRSSWAGDQNTRHVVWLQEWGVDPATGLFFEVQEYLQGGALAGADGVRGSWSRLGQWPVEVFASAVIDAVAGFHATVGGAHRDVKPQNLLVRSSDPLVLVLGDVGLSRQVGSGSVRFSKRDGSAAYQAPEAGAQGKVSRAGDWWSAGVMIAEAALGRHPLALPDGSLPDNRVLQTEMVERAMPLAGVSDPRLRLLCEGLLTRDSQLRWGLPQIAQWQAGGSPATGFADGGSVGSAAGSGGRAARRRSVLFAGRNYGSVEQLAAAFAADPQRAGELLFLTKDQNLLEELRLLLQAQGLHEAQAMISSYRSGAWQQTFLRLLTEMDPNLEPVLEGQDMTLAGITSVAQQVVAAGAATPAQESALAWVTEHQLWRIWRELPDMQGTTTPAERMPGSAADVLGSWYGAVILVDGKGVCRRRRSSGAEVSVVLSAEVVDRYWTGVKPVVSAWLVLAAVDADQVERESRRVIETERDRFTHQQWWLDLADGPIVDAITAVTATGLAQQASVALHEQLEAKRREEARLATEAKNAEARRARGLQIAAARRARELQVAAEVKRRDRLGKGITFTWWIALGLCILSWPLGIAVAKRIGWGCYNAWDCSPSYDAGVEGDRINTEFQAVVVVAACVLILAMASLTTLLLGLRRRVVVRRLDNLRGGWR